MMSRLIYCLLLCRMGLSTAAAQQEGGTIILGAYYEVPLNEGSAYSSYDIQTDYSVAGVYANIDWWSVFLEARIGVDLTNELVDGSMGFDTNFSFGHTIAPGRVQIPLFVTYGWNETNDNSAIDIQGRYYGGGMRLRFFLNNKLFVKGGVQYRRFFNYRNADKAFDFSQSQISTQVGIGIAIVSND